MQVGQRNMREWFLELCVVVAGIFLALMANNWNLERVDRAREREMLRSMLGDLDAEKLEIQRVLDFYEDSFEKLGSFDRIAASKDMPADERREGLAKIYRRLGTWEFLASKRYTYQAAKSSGALARIRNADVRKALAQAQAAFDGIDVQGDAMARIQIGLLTRDLVQQVDFRSGNFFDPASADDPRTANRVRLVLGTHRGFVDYLTQYRSACGELEKALRAVLEAGR